MKTDRLNPARTDKDIRRILELTIDVRRKWEEAVDVGVYAPRVESNGRGKGFHDLHPTESAAMAPTARQARGAARRAAVLIAEAKDRLDEAAQTLHAGLLRTDPEVLFDYLQKRAAALDK